MKTLATIFLSGLALTAWAGPLSGPQPNDDWAAPGPAHPPLKVGVILPPRVRTPQFPLKDKRTLFTDEEIRQARDNVAKYPAAQRVATDLMKEADYWVAWKDADLRDLIATAEVPRDAEVCPAGCPVHGKQIFEKTGKFYPWIIDPKVPFKVKCPIGGETYPSNDYGRFYRSGFKDRSDFDGPYVDDGRGWLAPNGQRYWFVAYATHWMWTIHDTSPHPSIRTGLAALGHAYLLTGDRRYAHTAAVMLHRVAEVYPNMDYESQSRYGQMMQEIDGSRYQGKAVNAIWETYQGAQYAETYDAIWETIDVDTALQQFLGKDGRSIRSFIEANLLEDSIDAIYEKRSRGNYGMHQRALLLLAIVRQHADTKRYLSDLLDRLEGSYYLGLRPALYTLVWRDGEPFESPGYNLLWVQNLTALVGLLPKLGVDVSTLPRLRRLYDAPLSAIAIGRHTPAIGDTTSIYGGVVGEDATVYQQAFRTYGDPRYASFLADFGAAGAQGFRDFNSLLHPPVPAAAARTDGRRGPPLPSRLLSGFGLALLNDAADETAVSIYFGQHINHWHFDRLHFEVFAHGWPMMPDLGYPDAMNVFVSGVWTWSVNTIAHNTVTVDAAAQPGNVPGRVELFADGGWVRSIAVSAPGTYPQCQDYRRQLVMVEHGAERYVVDFFNVAGGREHDYSLHGPTGTATLQGTEWTAPAPGTLAGKNVKLGELYDNPQMAAEGEKTGYYEYRGSGFQHIFNVQRRLAGDAIVDYVHEKDPAAALRIRTLAAPGVTLMAADARVSPVKNPSRLKYVIARHTASAGEPLVSEFVSVVEPHTTGTPLIAAVDRPGEGSGGKPLRVRRANGDWDLILRTGTSAVIDGHHVGHDGKLAVVRFKADGTLDGAFAAGGSWLEVDGRKFTAGNGLRGQVTAIDPAHSTIRVRTTAPAEGLVGRVAKFWQSAASTAHTIKSARREGDELVIETQDDLVAGLMRITGVKGARLDTRMRLPFAPSYVGATVVDANYRTIGLVAAADQDHLELAEPPGDPAALVGRDAWISSVGVGYECEIPAVVSWQR
ncbi:MAG TPA: heparinase II/III family protein [Opitutaceae bacterium]|nr:heparinase II/III family protein [Opitutaceae bacterium]